MNKMQISVLAKVFMLLSFFVVQWFFFSISRVFIEFGDQPIILLVMRTVMDWLSFSLALISTAFCWHVSQYPDLRSYVGRRRREKKKQKTKRTEKEKGDDERLSL